MTGIRLAVPLRESGWGQDALVGRYGFIADFSPCDVVWGAATIHHLHQGTLSVASARREHGPGENSGFDMRFIIFRPNVERPGDGFPCRRHLWRNAEPIMPETTVIFRRGIGHFNHHDRFIVDHVLSP